jgi:hypothetical protein
MSSAPSGAVRALHAADGGGAIARRTRALFGRAPKRLAQHRKARARPRGLVDIAVLGHERATSTTGRSTGCTSSARRIRAPPHLLLAGHRAWHRLGQGALSRHERHSRSRAQTATVTRRNVAGMDVASSFGLVFWALKRASNSACRSASRPLAAAASNAFIVGP